MRKAVLVGINNYPDPDARLAGCVNDVLGLRERLVTACEFRGENVRCLTDKRATKDAILLRLQWLLQGAKKGDELIFLFSGHGSQVVDRTEDEVNDHEDEILCPYDYDDLWEDPLSDDELGAMFSHDAGEAHLTVLLDSCHSGTATRGVHRSIGKTKSVRPPIDIAMRAQQSRAVTQRRFLDIQPGMTHLLVAGCRSDQTSSDAKIGGRPGGAFTTCLLQQLCDGGAAQTWLQAVEGTNALLVAEGFAQVAQLEGPAARMNGYPFVS